MKRPFDVPARIRTAGRLCLTLLGALSLAIGNNGICIGEMCETVESLGIRVLADLNCDRSIYTEQMRDVSVVGMRFELL